MKEQCLIGKQIIRYSSLAFCFLQLMKLSKADFPRGIITFRNIQHSIWEGPGMISLREKKLIGNFSSPICILMKQFYLQELMSAHWPTVTINLCQFTQWIISNVNIFPYTQMLLSIINPCCKKVNNEDIASQRTKHNWQGGSKNTFLSQYKIIKIYLCVMYFNMRYHPNK